MIRVLERWRCVRTASEEWFEECIPGVGTRAWKRKVWDASLSGVKGTFRETGEDGVIRDVEGTGWMSVLVGCLKRSDGDIRHLGSTVTNVGE